MDRRQRQNKNGDAVTDRTQQSRQAQISCEDKRLANLQEILEKKQQSTP